MSRIDRRLVGKYEPKRCFVGEKQKICYEDRETAEMSARLVEVEHGLEANSLSAYRCEYGNHWHLAKAMRK